SPRRFWRETAPDAGQRPPSDAGGSSPDRPRTLRSALHYRTAHRYSFLGMVPWLCLPIQCCLLHTQYRARGGIILLLTQVFHQPRNPMESGFFSPTISMLKCQTTFFSESWVRD